MRTLNDLTAGTCVYLQETRGNPSQIVNAPYIYLGLDNNDHALLLRKYYDPDAFCQLRSGSGTVGGDYAYAGGPADTYLTGNFYDLFDAATQAAMVDTNIICMNVGYAAGQHTLVTLQRKIFLLSRTEVGLEAQTAGSEGPSYLPALKAYYNTETDNTARATTSGPWRSTSGWWTRSPFQSTATYQFGRYGVNLSYQGYLQMTSLNSSLGMRPAIAFNKNTQVSDVGADRIFLLPEGRDTSFNLDVQFFFGTFQNHPKTVKVVLDGLETFSSYTIKVCGDYNTSGTPTWVTCNANGVASITEKATQDWQLGVWFVGAGRNEEAHIEQPNLIVEFEEE